MERRNSISSQHSEQQLLASQSALAAEDINTFTNTFNQNLITVLVSYFDFQSAFSCLANLNRRINKYFQEGGVDFIWKLLFTTEFSSFEYPDHKKEDSETHLQYFKRSFMKYKLFRHLLKNIFELTTEKRSSRKLLTSLRSSGFLRNFEDREVPQFNYIQEPITFEIECLFKNLNDQDPSNTVLDRDEKHEYFSNFKLTSLIFNNYDLQTVLLSPSSILNFRMILQLKTGLKCFPFTHTNKYRQCNFVDLNNYFGRGPNAILSITGTDKSQALFIAPSIESYLSKHCQLLKEDRLFVHQGEIQSFYKDPLENFGSVSIQNGIRIEVQA